MPKLTVPSELRDVDVARNSADRLQLHTGQMDRTECEEKMAQGSNWGSTVNRSPVDSSFSPSAYSAVALRSGSQEGQTL